MLLCLLFLKVDIFCGGVSANVCYCFFHCSLFLDDNTDLNFDTVKQVKNLGFIFDYTLCLEPQINQVIKTCCYRLHNLYRIISMLDKIENYSL